MSSAKLGSLLAALAAGVASAAAGAETLGPDAFAYGRDVELRSDGPLQTLLLDLAVYRGSVESGLADLRVFNGAGDPVPHGLRVLSEPRSLRAGPVEVPLFRLPAPEPGERSGRSRSVAEAGGARAYRIDAEVSDSGAIVRIRSEPGESAAPASERPLPEAYLVDASQLERPVLALELDLAPDTREFVVPVRVEGSDDLFRFRQLDTRATLVRLDQAGHRIDASDIELPESRYRYLRLSWPEERLPVAIERVRARLTPTTQPPGRGEVRIPARAVPDESGVFVFDLGGEVPVDRVQVDLPAPNTLVEARLFSGGSETGPWVRQYAGLLYELEHGRQLRNPAIPWRVTRQRYARLEVSAKGGGLGAGTPVLEASWHPEQLLFVTRGAPPFRLGYGRAGAPHTGFDAGELISTTKQSAGSVPRETAVLGAQFVTASPAVLEVPEEPVAMRTLALWGVLVLAVGVVLGLSVRLLRQLRAPSDGASR